MKISGFTFVKNATKLYYPVKESILSILPVVDEFVIALGKSDEDDYTKEEILSIQSEKIKIIDTEWNLEAYPHNTIFAQQTDLAKNACEGDWLFYLQSDELVHEKYLEIIKNACEKYLDDLEVEGLLFEYRHFWGDYEHYHEAHNWYPREIRIIRNDPKIHSWKDAQSFRKFDAFNYSYQDYSKKEGSQKLQVARIFAWIHHYGWVRPPRLMSAKTKSSATTFWGSRKAEDELKAMPESFDYGPLNKLKIYKDSHPNVLKSWIDKFDWQDQLQYDGKRNPRRLIHKHEKLRYRLLSHIEHNLLNGKQIGGFRNYRIVKEDKNHFG